MMNDSIESLVDQVVSFRDARNWKQFHNPKDLAISISLEASELLEIFQWTGENTKVNDQQLERIKEELADILNYAFILAHDLDLSIDSIVREKIEKNNKKYPIEKSFGRADKYTAYKTEGINDDCL